MWVQSLDQEDPLEECMVTHSCLENPMDRGDWQAAVHRVTKSQTRLTKTWCRSFLHGFNDLEMGLISCFSTALRLMSAVSGELPLHVTPG